MKRQFFLTAASLAGVLMLGASTYAAPMTLVSDNFDSAADGTSLNGRSPDVGANAWVSQTRSGEIFKVNANGQVYSTNTSGSGSQDAFVQFAPGNYDQYVIQAEVDMQSKDALVQWGIGFTNGTASFYTAGQLTVIMGTQNIFLEGPYNPTGGTNGAGATYVLASQSLGSGFDASKVHAVALIYNAKGNKASVTLDGNPIITGISLTNSSGNPYTPQLKYGSFVFQNPGSATPPAYTDNFSIAGNTVPEPGSLGILSSVVGLLMMRRSKK